jgi:hypothetical protein
MLAQIAALRSAGTLAWRQLPGVAVEMAHHSPAKVADCFDDDLVF